MKNGVNKCIFLGTLGSDPETGTTSGGTKFARFSIACGWKSGQREGTEWIPIQAYGKLAEICEQYLRKGSRVYIEGGYHTNKWEDKQGNTRYSTSIIAKEMRMLSEDKKQEPEPKQDDFDDDIPF